jgi:hypothetical protein
MHLAQRALRAMTCLVALPALVFALPGTAHADHRPLTGPGDPTPILGHAIVTSVEGAIIAVDPATVPCTQIATFEDVLGGDPPGTNFDGLLESGGLLFAERFEGQSLSYSGLFDVVSGVIEGPLALQQGLPGQNLDVFLFNSNVLAGLGHLGYPDIDAIGEGSMAILFWSVGTVDRRRSRSTAMTAPSSTPSPFPGWPTSPTASRPPTAPAASRAS